MYSSFKFVSDMSDEAKDHSTSTNYKIIFINILTTKFKYWIWNALEKNGFIKRMFICHVQVSSGRSTQQLGWIMSDVRPDILRAAVNVYKKVSYHRESISLYYTQLRHKIATILRVFSNRPNTANMTSHN